MLWSQIKLTPYDFSDLQESPANLIIARAPGGVGEGVHPRIYYIIIPLTGPHFDTVLSTEDETVQVVKTAQQNGCAHENGKTNRL